MITQREKTLQASEQYQGLLDKMETLTAELMEAVEAWDPEKVERLVDERSDLCEQIVRSVRDLELLDKENNGASNSPALSNLDEIIQRSYAKQQELLTQQVEAERLLTRELQRHRPALVDINQQRELHQTYRRAPAEQNARFLDSKL
jgi:hypothetical protein